MKSASKQKRRPADNRSHKRYPLNIWARFMRPDAREYRCVIRDMSASGVYITTPALLQRGDRIIIYADEIGRFVCDVLRIGDQGVAARIHMSPRKIERTERRLGELAGEAGDGGHAAAAESAGAPTPGQAPSEHPPGPRRKPNRVEITLLDGLQVHGEVSDVWADFMTIDVHVDVKIYDRVLVDGRRAEIRSHSPHDITVRYL